MYEWICLFVFVSSLFASCPETFPSLFIRSRSRRRTFRFGVYFIYFLSFFLFALFHSHSYLFIFFSYYYYFAIHRDFDSNRQEFTYIYTKRGRSDGKKNRQSTNGISLKRYMTMNNFIIYNAFNVAKNGANENFAIELATITIRKHFFPVSICFVHEGHKFSWWTMFGFLNVYKPNGIKHIYTHTHSHTHTIGKIHQN